MRSLSQACTAAIGVTLSSDVFSQPATASTLKQFSQLPWNWDPWILAGLALAAAGYICGLRQLDRVTRSRVVGPTRSVAFATGIVTLFIVLISPFDALDDQLFSAHMVQHLALMLVAPPLLITGRPGIVWLWALPLSMRRALARIWSRSGLHAATYPLMSPLLVWMLCSAALWFWHLPGPYGWALASEPVHAFEHFCFFTTSLMFWSLVLEPPGHRRMEYGMTLLFVAAFGVQNGLLGAVLTFAGRPLYAAYLTTTAGWGLSPLEDQQLAGLLMWIPASLIHLTTLGVLFVAWMNAAERRALLTAPRRPEQNKIDAICQG